MAGIFRVLQRCTWAADMRSLDLRRVTYDGEALATPPRLPALRVLYGPVKHHLSAQHLTSMTYIVYGEQGFINMPVPSVKTPHSHRQSSPGGTYTAPKASSEFRISEYACPKFVPHL